MRIDSFSGDHEILRELGARLKVARISCNLTQQELAEKTGINRMTISCMEKDGQGTLQTFVRTLRGLGMVGRLEGVLDEPRLGPLAARKFVGKQRLMVRHSKKEIP